LWNNLPLPSTFPALVELSVNHQFSGGFLRVKAFELLASCPRLRQFVLMGFLRATNPFKLVDKIKAFAPSLKTLCIPYSSLDNPQSLLFTYNGYVTTGCPASDGNELVVFLRRLEYLAVRGPGKWFSPYSAERLTSGDHKVVVVERVWERGGKDKALQEWKSAWLDGIAGGEGYWDLSGKRLNYIQYFVAFVNLVSPERCRQPTAI
jgi:hypothetical protein